MSSSPLNARYLEKLPRVQEILISRVAARLGGTPARADDPPAAAVVGAAFACMQAARTAWLESDYQRPFSSYLDNAMSSFAVQP